MTAGGGAVAGSFAGPAGTALGVSIGLCIDYVTNKGVEFIQRGELVEDVNTMIVSTQNVYYRVLEEELHRAVNVLIEDAMQLMPSVLERR